MMIKFKIKSILKERELSIYWVAKHTNVSYPTVYNLVNNKTESIAFYTLEEIMNALDIKDFNKIMTIKSDKND